MIKFDTSFVLTILFPFLGFALALIIFILQKTRKQIGYKIISSTSVPTYDKPISELKYPNKEIIIEYKNTGNTDLEFSDFHTPIKTNFSANKIITAKRHFQKSYRDDDINFEVTIDGSNSFFKPDLLNPKESIFIYYYINEFKSKLNVSSKIKNGREIYNIDIKTNFYEKMAFLFLLYITLLINGIYKTGYILFAESAVMLFTFSAAFTYWVIKDYTRIIRTQFK